MIKKQLIFGLLSIGVILTSIFSRLNNWSGNDKIFLLGLVILFMVTIISIVKAKGQRIKTMISGLIWISLTILIVGITFQNLNYSKTLLPTYRLGNKLNTINVDYPSYKWANAVPEKQNVEQQIIDSILSNKLEESYYSLSLLIVKNDTLLTEKYFKGTNSKTAFNIQSATKSFVSVLTGISIDKGLIPSDTSKIRGLIPEYFTPETEPLKNNITVKHLLTMQAGWDANNGKNLKGYDWIKSTMSNKLKFNPGSSFLYSDIEPHILLGIIESSSKQNILDFAKENLCNKLGITITDWLKSPNDLCMGGGPLFMTTRDMARFGDLILKNGKIDNQKIVDSLWTAKMTTNYVEKSLMPENVPSKKYGYLLWLDSYNENEIFLVAGAGGQLIMIVPVLDMILVTTTKTDLPPIRLADNALNIQKLLTDYVRFEIDKMKE
jgi:CubicO group peptidase (beta-lactamase class C family)